MTNTLQILKATYVLKKREKNLSERAFFDRVIEEKRQKGPGGMELLQY